MTTAPLLAPAPPEAPTTHRCQGCHTDVPRTALLPLTVDLAPRKGERFDTSMVYRCTNAAARLARARRNRVGAFE